MNCLRLIPLSPKFLPNVLELDQQCFGGLWTADGYQREIESPNSDLLILVAIADPSTALQVVGLGCLWAILEEAHITLLGINPAYRRQGLGQLMLYGLLQSAHRRGLERATLEVRASNQEAIALYQKFGFRLAGQRRHYYPDDEDALILWRSGLDSTHFEDELHQWGSRCDQRLQQEGWEFQDCSAGHYATPANS